jgi:hypothetical protein
VGRRLKHIGIVHILKVREEFSIIMEIISKETINYHRNKVLDSINGKTRNMRDSLRRILCRVMHVWGSLKSKVTRAEFAMVSVMVEEYIDTVMEIYSKGSGKMIKNYWVFIDFMKELPLKEDLKKML